MHYLANNYVPTTIVRYHVPVNHHRFIIASIIVTLTILGVLKTLIGFLCSSSIERWGLNELLSCNCELCDEFCLLRIKRKLFLFNIVFFFIAPFLFIYCLLKKVRIECDRPICKPNPKTWVVSTNGKKISVIKNDCCKVQSHPLINTDEELEDMKFIEQILANTDELNNCNQQFVFECSRTGKTDNCSCVSLKKTKDYTCYSNTGSYVRKLLTANIVYRNLKYPLGTIKLPKCCPYSIIGTFVQTKYKTFKFSPLIPFKQYWTFCGDHFENLPKPKDLDFRDFYVIYSNPEEVYCVNELSTEAKYFCVNQK